MGTKEEQAQGEKRTAKLPSWIRSLGPIGGLLAILAIPAGGYALYVIDQLRDVEDQNLRTLAKAAGTVESLVDNFHSNVKNLAGDPPYACEFQRRQSRLRLVHPQKCEEIEARKASEYENKAVVKSDTEGLIFTVPLKTEQNDGVDDDATDPTNLDASADDDATDPTNLDASADDDATDPTDLDASADDDATDPTNLDASADDDTAEPAIKDDMVWAIRFDRVLAEIPFGDSMDVLLIADSSGKVVKQHPDPTAPQSSRHTARGIDDFSGVGLSKRGIRIDNLEKIRPLEGESKPSDELGYGSTMQTVLVADTGYKMLCQPLVLKLPEPNGNSEEQQSWVLCGLVEEHQALRDALEVAPFLTVSLFGLFFFSLFLWPVAKILTMSPRERFRFADVYLLLLGTWGALMLATILVVTLDTYGEFKDQAAISLEQLADDIEENLGTELGKMHKQLRAYDLDLNGKLKLWLEERDDGGEPVVPGDPPPYALPEGIVDRTSLLNVALPTDAETGKPVYPFFSSLYWIEPCSGQQIAKGAIRRKNTPRVDVSQRAYFQRVQEDKLWQLPGTTNSSDRYYLQTDRSLTTGEFFAALSTTSVITNRPTTTSVGEENEDGQSTLERYWAEFADSEGTDRKDTDPDDSNQGVYQSLVKRYGRCGASPQAVTVMSGQLTSITNPVLAPGVGFAIVDSSGDVIFHSDERRAKFENFFEEVSDGEHLKSILRAGIASRLDTKYRAQPHQVFARPMQQLPWAVVTFLDDEVLRTSFLESLMHSVMLMLVHLVLYFLATVLYLAFWGRSSPVWMWPYLSDRASDYRWLAWMLLVLLLGTNLVLHNFNGLKLWLFGLLVPLVPIIVASLGPMFRRQERKGRFVRRLIMLSASIAALFSLAISFSQAGQQPLTTADYVLVGVLLLVWLPGTLIAITRVDRDPSDDLSLISGGERRNALTAYIIVAVLMWAIIAILPAYGYAKLAVNDQIGVMVKYENQAAARRIAARADAIKEYYLQVDMKRDYEGRRKQHDQKDVYWSSLYWQRYDSRLVTQQTSESQREMRPLQSAYPWREIARFLPIYNETSRDMRYFQQAVGAGDGRWMTDGVGLMAFDATDHPRGTRYRLYSQPVMVFPALGIPTMLAAILILIVVFLWSRYGARKMFFGDITPGSVSVKWKQSWGRIEASAESARDFRVFSPRRGLYRKVEPEWLTRELETIQKLHGLDDVDEGELLQRFGTRKEVLDYINELIEPTYCAEWDSCSREERLVLVQLAQEGVANPKQAQAVRSLIKRGLLFKDPALRIVNQSFALFASSKYEPHEVKRQESKHEGAVNWASTQKILFAAIVLLLVFLITTQPAAVETLTKFFTGTAASVVAIITLANKFSGLGGGGGGS